MVRKRVDDRVRKLLERSAASNTRNLLLLVGDGAPSQAARVHSMVQQAQPGESLGASPTAPSCLWLHASSLPLSSHRKKRMKQLKAQRRKGASDSASDDADPLSRLLSSGSAECVPYRSASKRALGRTFRTVVLQDFQSLTPNLLAKASECCAGGGSVILLVHRLPSLSSLYTLAMDVHTRFRTESHQEAIARFNERMLLKLSQCDCALVLDDELNVLPISSSCSQSTSNNKEFNGNTTNASSHTSTYAASSSSSALLTKLIESARGLEPDNVLIKACKTADQAKVLTSLLTSARNLQLTASASSGWSIAASGASAAASLVTAPRGRGKSAAMGLAASGAIAMGVSSVAVSAPSQENLKAFFDFVQHGLVACGYSKHQHFSCNSDSGSRDKLVSKVSVFKDRQQSVTFVDPLSLAHSSVAAEFIVVDEAAAIPLPTLQKIASPSANSGVTLTVFSSTTSGYEGTGRSLSFKLTKWLRSKHTSKLSEHNLSEPIRYAPNDPLERFINGLLCLDSHERLPRIVHALPQPEQCELYAVNRDTLFSCHPAAERFLQQVMALYASSHYRTSPDDLQLLSDAPAHRLFVLLPPVSENDSSLPEVLAVVQLSFEGSISRQSARKALAGGSAPSGDLVPWTISQQFQDHDFPGLSGVRIVRIAVHPEVQRAGYGSRAMKLLHEYFDGLLAPLTEKDPSEAGYQPEPSAPAVDPEAFKLENQQEHSLHNEKPVPRSQLPPLLQPLTERQPERISWIGAAFGMSEELMRFWSRIGYTPLYLRQTHSSATAEHTCLILREVHPNSAAVQSAGKLQVPHPEAGWLERFASEFRCRLSSLLGGPFRDLPPSLALALLLHDSAPNGRKENEIEDRDAVTDENREHESNGSAQPRVTSLSAVVKPDGRLMSQTDLARLSAYARGISDHSTVRDLVPSLANALFFNRLRVGLSHAQSAMLLVIGLQQRDIRDAAEGLDLPQEQALALYGKALRKVHKALISGAEAEAESELERKQPSIPGAVHEELDEELDEEANTSEAMQQKQKKVLGTSENLKEFAIDESAQEWNAALTIGTTQSGRISVKSNSKRKRQLPSRNEEDGNDSKRNVKPTMKTKRKKPDSKRKSLGD